MAAPVLRPRSVPEIIDAAFQLARGHFMPLLVLSVIVVIPTVIIGGINAWLLPTQDPGNPFGDAWLATIPLTILSACWTIVGYGAVTIAAADAYLGGAPDAGGALQRAFGRAWALIAGNALGYFIMVLPFVVAGVLFAMFAGGLAEDGPAPTGGALVAVIVATLMMLFGIFWMVITMAKLALLTPVASLERAGALESWSRAKRLAEGSKLRILALLIVAGAVVVGVAMAGFMILALIIRNENMASALAGVVAVPLWPVLGSLFVVLYYDLRIRKEAFDLEEMARGLGGPGTVEPGAIPRF